jgi:hypothetical protein
MADAPLDLQLRQLELLRVSFRRSDSPRITSLLSRLGKRRVPDAASLIRFHEAVLFFRAFPPNPAVLRQTESLLHGFSKRVQALRDGGADLSGFDAFEASGIAGTSMQDTLSFDMVRWLVRHLPRVVEIAWDDYEDERALGLVWPLLMPLQAEDAWVEANIPWRKWLAAAIPAGRGELRWIVEQIENLPGSDKEKARVYDLLRLPVRWAVATHGYSRTLNWRRPRGLYYHRDPLIPRSAVSLANQLSQAAPAFHRLSRPEGTTIMDRIREIMLVRYRELYGTTLGDPGSVVCAEVGRGVVIYLWNLPPERRLPLRAYVAGFTVKNGVPINYIEAIGLCEWIEVGFNTFYTFRGGEVAWIFAQVLRCLRHLTGATCISMYPYQLGDQNEEAIESGAYWFYRKLGFRPARKDLVELVEREERRIAASSRYRTSASTLRRLASAHLIYELPGSKAGAWDHFSTRNLGLAATRRMARDFEGDAEKLRRAACASLAKVLGVNLSRWTGLERAAFEDFAVVLAGAPGMISWSQREKRDLLHLIRTKPARAEMRYLHLTQKHQRLREMILELGSTNFGGRKARAATEPGSRTG